MLIIVLDPPKSHVRRYVVLVLLMRNGGLGVKQLPMDVQLAGGRLERGTQAIQLHTVLYSEPCRDLGAQWRRGK